jgi:hypothetical protein
MKNKKLLPASVILCLLASCKSVKPYEMVYLNDSEMQMGNNSAKNYEDYVESIREGATPSGGNKSSGGCGCN